MSKFRLLPEARMSRRPMRVFGHWLSARAHLQTKDGEAELATLAVGDWIASSDGSFKQVRQLSSTLIDCSWHPDAGRFMPVCVAAHAFGPTFPLAPFSSHQTCPLRSMLALVRYKFSSEKQSMTQRSNAFGQIKLNSGMLDWEINRRSSSKTCLAQHIYPARHITTSKRITR